MKTNINPEIRRSLEEALKLQSEVIRLAVDHVSSETLAIHVGTARELFYLISAIDQDPTQTG